MWASPILVIIAISGFISFDSFLISPALLMPISNTPNLLSNFKLDKLNGTPMWLLNDLGEL